MADSGLKPDGSWEPAFEGQRPPFEPGNEIGQLGGRPPTVGAYSEERLGPLRAAIEARLAEVSAVYAEADDEARRMLANQLARCEVTHRWLDENGLVDDAGRPRPVLTDLVKWENSARQMMRELGMTTVSRAELDLTNLHAANEWVALAEVQRSLQAALELATRYVPSERRHAYLREVRELLGAAGADAQGMLES